MKKKVSKFKPVRDLMRLTVMERIDFRVIRGNAERARRLLQVEASHGRVTAAYERQVDINVTAGMAGIMGDRTRTVTLPATEFIVITPSEASPELQIRLASELECSAQSHSFYLRAREIGTA